MNDSVHKTAENRRSEISKCSAKYDRETTETMYKECQLLKTKNIKKNLIVIQRQPVAV